MPCRGSASAQAAEAGTRPAHRAAAHTAAAAAREHWRIPAAAAQKAAHSPAAERAGSTIVKYRRELNQLAVWLAGRPASQERLTEWKAALAAQGYAPRTINAMLAAANGFFGHMGWEIHLKLLKIQRRLFRDTARELSRAEYERLLAAAKDSGLERLALIMETLCATGIRISELRYMTIEAAQTGQATIALKGKIRTILLSTKLCRKLL